MLKGDFQAAAVVPHALVAIRSAYAEAQRARNESTELHVKPVATRPKHSNVKRNVRIQRIIFPTVRGLHPPDGRT
jgi:hypothetical protein